MTCALVPPMPKEDTPARRGRSVAGQARGLGQQLDGARRPVDVRGRPVDVQRPREHAVPHAPCTILITPATPAAAWVCPMFDFTEPSHSGRSAGRSWP